MKPKNRKDLVEIVAKDLELDRDDVDDLIQHYYKTVLYELQNTDCLHVNVKHIGYFYVKPWSVKKMHEDKTALIENIEKIPMDNLKRYAISKNVQEELNYLDRIKVLLGEQKSKKDEKKEERRIYEAAKGVEGEG